MSAKEMSEWVQRRTAEAEERKKETPQPELPDVLHLQRYLAAEMPDARGVTVENLQQISYGAAREHYSFDASWRQGVRDVHRSLILLRDFEIPEAFAVQPALLDPEDSTMLWVLGRGNREAEFQILEFLERTSVPAPRIHQADWDAGGLASLGVPTVSSEEYVKRVLDHLDHSIQFSCEERPAVVRRALDWLRAQKLRIDRVALCHGDYKTDNLIFEGDRIRAIIDWEFAHLGDPLEDVGGACMGLHARDGEMMGLMPRADLLAAYERAVGERVDVDRVRFWEIMQTLRMTSFIYLMLNGARRHVEMLTEPLPEGEWEASEAFMLSMINRMLGDLEGEFS
jgi:tRNA A-37 threonylcarbamoyl transferase component Bud32